MDKSHTRYKPSHLLLLFVLNKFKYFRFIRYALYTLGPLIPKSNG